MSVPLLIGAMPSSQPNLFSQAADAIARHEVANLTKVGAWTFDFAKQALAWSQDQQIISAYYWVSLDWKAIPVQAEKNYPIHDGEYFRWISIDEISEKDVDFPIDRVVVGKVIRENK